MKQNKDILMKKEEMLKQTQKQLKIMEGKVFQLEKNSKNINVNEINSKIININQVNNNNNSQQYAYPLTRRSQSSQQSQLSQFSSPNSYKRMRSTILLSSKKQQLIINPNNNNTNLCEQNKKLRQQVEQKSRRISQLQQKIYKSKSPQFSSNSSNNSSNTTYQYVPMMYMKNMNKRVSQTYSIIQKNEQIDNKTSTKTNNTTLHTQQSLKSLLLNLQLIQKHISSTAFDTGSKYQKHKVQLISLINKNKKLLNDTEFYENIKQLTNIITKAKNTILNRVKNDMQIKNIISQEFMNILGLIEQIKAK